MAQPNKTGGKPGKGTRPVTIVIRREEAAEGGHHGGAWKVAYADFVTAMMAFFLLMWLLNATTEQQRRGLADYFSPTNVLGNTSSGYGAPFGGKTMNSDGSMVSDKGSVQVISAPENQAPSEPDPERERQAPGMPQAGGDGPDAADGQSPVARLDPGPDAGQARANAGGAGEAMRPPKLADAAKQLKEALRADPGLADVARQVSVDLVPEGLRIQLLDEDRQPWFPNGGSVPNDRARAVLARIVPVLLKMPDPVTITGHTDAAPFRGGSRTNWDLSAERANATRRLLSEAGLPDMRIRTITGMADRELLLPADPNASANRRIAITVLRKGG